MKILQLCNKFPYPPKDGGAIAIFNLTKGFQYNGHHVKILAINTKKHYINPDIVYDALKDIAEFDFIYLNTDVNPVKVFINLFFSGLPYNVERFISKKFNKKIVELLNEEDFDIVQLEGLYLIPYVKTIRQNSDAKISLRSHNIEHEIWKRIAHNKRNILTKKYLQILANRIKKFEINSLNVYDLLVPITQRDANILNNLGNNKPYQVCPSGMDIEKISEGNKNVNYHSLFFIGSLDWIPNQEGLLWFTENVWPKISIKNPKIEFFIAGRNAPKKLIQKLLNFKNIVFLGEVDDAFEYMMSKSIMVVPLFSGSGMRVKIIEGMALGKVIVTTSLGAEGIDVKHKKDILIADSADDFEKEIEILLENKSFFTKIGENAKTFIVKNMDNKKISAELTEFYKTYLI